MSNEQTPHSHDHHQSIFPRKKRFSPREEKVGKFNPYLALTAIIIAAGISLISKWTHVHLF